MISPEPSCTVGLYSFTAECYQSFRSMAVCSKVLYWHYAMAIYLEVYSDNITKERL